LSAALISSVMFDDLAAAVVDGDRNALGRAITLVESTVREHRREAAALLEMLQPHTGKAQRIGITGVPGVGKSTFIETLGTRLTAAQHRVAVVAVDPSSSLSGGSILADKTRMSRLAVDDRAFIRPTPAGGTLGGVAASTFETMLVLEAAGYDIIIVETVGVGQSETLVSSLVDTFVVLMLAGAGDELQGIKRGVLELADLLAVNKADGENITSANLAASQYRRALELLVPQSSGWRVPVVTCSAQSGEGIDEVWRQIQDHRQIQSANGELEQRRSKQQLGWMRKLVRERILAQTVAERSFKVRNAELESAVEAGELAPTVAVDILFDTPVAGT